MTENTLPNDVKSTAVSITLNAKSLGVDAFIKLEQTCEFINPITEVEALVKREEMATLLTEQALEIVKDTANKVKQHAAENPIGHVSVHQVNPTPAPVGSMNGQSYQGSGAGAVRAVANGASTGSDWRTAPDKWDSAKQVRYLSTQSLPIETLRNNVNQWLATNGFNPEAFDVWDERREAEQGKAIGSIINVKVKEAFRDICPRELIYTDKGGVKSLVSGKFNADGSLYIYWVNKQVDAAVKYGALDGLKSFN